MTAPDRKLLRRSLQAALAHVGRLAAAGVPGLTLIDRRGIAGDRPARRVPPRGRR